MAADARRRWACTCSGSRSRTAARTCSATRAGAGGGQSLMFNGHMDTSYSGREPWLRAVPGFQPQAFERDGRLYGLGHLEHEGRARLLRRGACARSQDAGVRLRGDVMIAAVCGEIEKTQYGRRAGRAVPRLRRRLALPRHARRRRRHVPARRADRGQGRARPLRLALGAHPRARRLHPHRVQRGPGATSNSILRMHDVLAAVKEWIPALGERPVERLPRREGDRQRRRDRGRLRLARLAHAAPHRPLPRRARAADEGDGALRAREVLDDGRASLPHDVEGGDLRHRAGRARSTRATSSSRAVDTAHEAVFGATPERDVTRWFSDASALTRYGIPTVNYGTSTGLMDVELGENLEIDGLVKTAEVYARVAHGGLRCRMTSTRCRRTCRCRRTTARADHLPGLELPELVLESSQGPVDVRDFDRRSTSTRAAAGPACRSFPAGTRPRARAGARRSPARSATSIRESRRARRRPLGADARRPASSSPSGTACRSR